MATTSSTEATELAFAGLAGQAGLVRSGSVSSRELTELCLERIERLDRTLNAFRVVLAEQALAAADQADARRRAGDDRPLLGVPVAVKDDMDMAGEVTAKGSVAHGPPAAADSEIVRRLRSAGAILIGKTNVPEMTITPWTETPAYGVTRNPWDHDRTPGGSSGGSAAAVAAGLVAAATASDGAGSIRIPAACCGLVGLKPQRGRVSIAPDASGWHGMTAYGTVTRTVADTALFLDAVKESGPSFAEAAARDPGKLRIAISTRVPPPIMARPDSEQRAAVDRVAEALRGLGHEVLERDLDTGRIVTSVIARYLRGIHDDAAAMPHPDRLTRLTRGFSRMGGAIPMSLVQKALDAESAEAERLNAIFRSGFDVVLTPMFTRRPPQILEYEGKGAQWTFNAAARFTPYPGAFNHTGQPAMAVPAGLTTDGFPTGVQLVAAPDGEPVLLSLATQLEGALDWPAQRPPLAL